MNWGKSIVVVYGLFVVGMVYLVYQSTQQNIDLVDKNYYQKEIQFQSEIDATNKANQHGIVPKIVADGGQEFLVVLDTASFELHGSAQFYCPSNAKFDVFMDLPLSKTGKWKLPAAQIQKATYQLKVIWVNERNDTFQSVINYTK